MEEFKHVRFPFPAAIVAVRLSCEENAKRHDFFVDVEMIHQARALVPMPQSVGPLGAGPPPQWL
jgi:hypothetical protein